MLIYMESNENTAMAALDLSAVFDTVNHKILIKVWKSTLAYRKKASNWIKCYLQNRKFQVHFNGTPSEKLQ